MGPAFANIVAFNIVLDSANRFDEIHCLCLCDFVLSFNMVFHLTDRFGEIHGFCVFAVVGQLFRHQTLISVAAVLGKVQ